MARTGVLALGKHTMCTAQPGNVKTAHANWKQMLRNSSTELHSLNQKNDPVRRPGSKDQLWTR